jgi:hypothetical protein
MKKEYKEIIGMDATLDYDNMGFCTTNVLLSALVYMLFDDGTPKDMLDDHERLMALKIVLKLKERFNKCTGVC